MISFQMVRNITFNVPFRKLTMPVIEASLAHLEDVNARLAETHEELRKEVVSLQAQLKASQDSERMSVIQEMISVREHAST